MNLFENKELFVDLLNAINDETDIAVDYIEKDFHAISILKELVSRNENYVFKGGTSLSVCQKVINRFSEDIDISYALEHITVGQRKRVKREFFESVEATGLIVGNAENIRSRRVFNRYLCPYIAVWSGKEDRVIVEWATQTPAFPIEIKSAQTIIGKYLIEHNRLDLVKKYNLESFEVKTITKERTFVDKVFAICDYHISKKIARQSRHIYDLHQLLKCISLDDDIIQLFNKVKSYRINLDTCHSVKTEKSISSYLFELIEEKTYYDDYQTRTFPLLYDHVSYDEAIKSIEKIAIFFKNKGY